MTKARKNFYNEISYPARDFLAEGRNDRANRGPRAHLTSEGTGQSVEPGQNLGRLANGARGSTRSGHFRMDRVGMKNSEEDGLDKEERWLEVEKSV